MARDLILQEAIVALRDALGAELDAIRVSRAVIGLYFTGVALDCGTAGACHTPPKSAMHEACCPMGEQVMPFPGTLRGRPATDLWEYALSPNLLARAVGIATLNALAELLWQRRPHPGADLRANLDGFDAAAIRPDEHVVLVGAFIPFLRALKQRRQPYTVLELSTAMLKPEELLHYRPAADAADVIPGGDVVLLTGSTLLTHTLDDLLRLCRPQARSWWSGRLPGCCRSRCCAAEWTSSAASASPPARRRSWTCWPRAAPARISSAARPSAGAGPARPEAGPGLKGTR